MLSYEDGIAAIAWLERVFGFCERSEARILMPDGSLGHAEMETDHGLIMLSTTGEGYESPLRHREHCERARVWSQSKYLINGLLVYVDDVDAHLQRAKQGGANILSGPDGGFPGKRYRAEDLEGQRWMFLQPLS
jgi:PhnB protein